MLEREGTSCPHCAKSCATFYSSTLRTRYCGYKVTETFQQHVWATAKYHPASLCVTLYNVNSKHGREPVAQLCCTYPLWTKRSQELILQTICHWDRKVHRETGSKIPSVWNVNSNARSHGLMVSAQWDVFVPSPLLRTLLYMLIEILRRDFIILRIFSVAWNPG